MDFDHFTVVLLASPTADPELDENESAAIQDAHLNHLATLHEAGELIAAGPLRDPDGRFRGLSIFSVDADEARRLSEADPAVRAGVFGLEVVPWIVPAGAVAWSPAAFPHSAAEAGG
jgi:uncharacterized protein YciI